MSEDSKGNQVSCPPYWEVWFVRAKHKRTLYQEDTDQPDDTFEWSNAKNPNCTLVNTKGTWEIKGTTIFYEWPWVYGTTPAQQLAILNTLPSTFGGNPVLVPGGSVQNPYFNKTSTPCPLSKDLPSTWQDPTAKPNTPAFPKDGIATKEKRIKVRWDCCDGKWVKQR